MQILSFPTGEKPKKKETDRGRFAVAIERISPSERVEISRVIDLMNDTKEILLIDIVSANDSKASVWKVPHGMSWYGLPILTRAFATAEWYSSRIYFATKYEYMDFMANRYKLSLIECVGVCPYCGRPMMNQLRYMFSDGSGMPFDIHFCSQECLKDFMLNFQANSKIFAKYLNHIDLHGPFDDLK